MPDGYFEALRARFAQGQQAALIGIPLGNSKEGYTNSVIGLSPGAQIYSFDKHHLVPFGEFIPPLFKWFTRMMNIPLGDFNRGPSASPPSSGRASAWRPTSATKTCSAKSWARSFANPATAPTILVNVSNIAWFGNTVAIDQHLQISRMRAIEFERPMLRATNTGATVIIDHRGQVTHSLPRHTRGVLAGEVEGRSAITPYARWVSRLGLWPLWLFAVAIVGLAAWRHRRRLKTCNFAGADPHRKIGGLPLRFADVDLPANHPEAAVLLGRAGLRAAAAL